MGIVDEDVAAVRAASDIVAIVSQYTQLRQVGRRWQGLCPFHQEKTPSFSVNAEERVYYCFGCHASGDVISFVEEMEHLDFPAAVEWLAPKAGITLRYTDRHEGEGRRRRARLIEVVERAVAWYHERLLAAPDAGAARRYLRERGIDGDTVREFRLGWAPDGWDELCRALRLDEPTAREAGLGRLNRRGRLQDHFRARIMFPIFDDQGRPIGFGGRILPGVERPGNAGKYHNTPETPLYHKGRVLYGLDRAKAAMVAADTVVLCEGYTDVIGFHRAGVRTAVATCGTALTDDHVKLLRRFARRFVLAFDADSAGQAAAERFYRWEREHDLEVAVADLPPGQDPADLAQSDPGRLAPAVEGARPFLRFLLDRVFAAADLTTPEGRARAAERALVVLADHPAELVRDQYVMDVASRCRIEPDHLRGLLERERRRARSRSRGRRTAGTAAPALGSPPAKGGDGGRFRPGGPPEEPPWHAPPAAAGARSAGGAVGSAPRPGAQAAGDASGGRAVDPGPPGDIAGPGGAGPGGLVTSPSAEALRAGPALEVLRHAVHDPESVAPWLDEVVFDDPVHAAVYRALIESDTHEAALASARPAAADLLARLLVEEPASEPFDAVRRALTEVARRHVRRLRLAGARAEDPALALADLALLVQTMNELADPASATEAADRLLAWLRNGLETGDD